MELPGGWDSSARLVAGRWVDRSPRRPAVAERLLRETRLMPWLAPRLPLRVPVPHVMSETPLVVRHDVVPGEPLTQPVAAHGLTLGGFLRALHDCQVADAVTHGAGPDEEHAATVDRFRAAVVPMLPPARRQAAHELLDAVREQAADTLVHGDLGPEHVLCQDDVLTGVIDFGDAHVGEAAIDLAWALHGTPVAFADAVAAAYGVTGDQRERALAWHRLGPWHEVTHGLDTDDPGAVRSGLAGVLSRLP